jgi:hypothetical protein
MRPCRRGSPQRRLEERRAAFAAVFAKSSANALAQRDDLWLSHY